MDCNVRTHTNLIALKIVSRIRMDDDNGYDGELAKWHWGILSYFWSGIYDFVYVTLDLIEVELL